MTVAEYRTAAAKAMPERDLQDQIVALAKAHGWLIFHTFTAKNSEPGLPDLCMVRGDRLVFAELKTERGRVSEDQQKWLNRLDGAVPAGSVWVWRPTDLLAGCVEAVLR